MANINRKSVDVDPEAERLWDMFTYSVEEQQNDIDRMKDMRKTLDAQIDDSVWPTHAKFPLSEAWSTAESAVGPALEYMFPPSRFLSVITSDRVDGEVLDKIAWALYVQMIYRMKLKLNCARSIRDTFSVSIGYSIIEPITVTPPTGFEIVAGQNRTRQMGRGRPVRGLRLKYVSSGKVIPFPEGTDFNGNDPTPCAFYLDSYPEHQFRKLFDKDSGDGEDILLKGSAEEIIEAARAAMPIANASMADFVDDMSGRSARSHKSVSKNIPVSVPVLKCYEDGKHTWIFVERGGARKVIHQDSSFAATRKPLTKWDPWLDSDRWFPMSQPEADMHNVWAKNVWFNAVFDLMTYALKRPLVYDSTDTDEKTAKKLLSARGIVGIPGDANRTAQFLNTPGVSGDVIQFGAVIDDNRRRLTGQRDMTDKNYTRGGSMAFDKLLESSTGREMLRHAMLQLGGLQSIADQVMIYMQTFGNEMDLRFQRPAYRDGKDYFEQFEVTEDDLRHGYDIQINLDDKRKMGGMDAQMRLQMFSAKRDNPYLDQYEVHKDLFFDEETMQRQLLPRDVVRQKQAEREQASLEAQRLGIEQAQARGQEGAAQALVGAQAGGA